MTLSAVTPGPPRWLLAAKVLLVGLLLTGALFPGIGGFAGKGMAFRLPLFTAPALIVPLTWLRHRARGYQALLDAGFTLPFLIDTAANAVGLYDHVDATDDVLHFVNWVFLVAGITAAYSTKVRADTPRWLLAVAGAGTGAAAIIGWEICEYATMQAGVAGLHLTYGDTLGDLFLSTLGGTVGAIAVLAGRT
jgi:hypothetical protein